MRFRRKIKQFKKDKVYETTKDKLGRLERVNKMLEDRLIKQG